MKGEKKWHIPVIAIGDGPIGKVVLFKFVILFFSPVILKRSIEIIELIWNEIGREKETVTYNEVDHQMTMDMDERSEKKNVRHERVLLKKKGDQVEISGDYTKREFRKLLLSPSITPLISDNEDVST